MADSKNNKNTKSPAAAGQVPAKPPAPLGTVANGPPGIKPTPEPVQKPAPAPVPKPETTPVHLTNFLVKETSPGLPLLIVFSSVNSNGFSFLERFDDLSANRIFIRDPYDAWYNRGIGDGVDTLDSLAARLAAEVKRLRPSRIITFGTSMGGYAALLFGLKLQAASIIAVSPQSILDPRLPHTPSQAFPGPNFDLLPMMQTPPEDSRITLFFGAADMVDCYNALRVSGPQVKLIPIKDADHLVAATLTKNGALTTAVRAAVDKKPFSYKEDIDRGLVDSVVTELIIRTVESHYLDADHNVSKCARALVALRPGWSPPLFVLAQMYDARKDYDQAARHARAAAEAAPASVTCADYLATVLHRMGDEQGAIDAYVATLAIRPRHYNALCGLAALRAKAGDSKTALELIDRAIQTRPRLTRAASLRDAILSGSLRDGGPAGDTDKNQL